MDRCLQRKDDLAMISFIKYALVCILILLALYTDSKSYKIKNNMLIIFALLGLFIHIIESGISGIGSWAAGLLLPFVILFVFFMLRVLGAGDVKLVSTISCILGIGFVKEASLYMLVIAGLMALIKMSYHRNFTQRMKHFFRFIHQCFMTRQVREYDDLHTKDKSHVIRLSYAIGLGTLWQMILEINQIYHVIG